MSRGVLLPVILGIAVLGLIGFSEDAFALTVDFNAVTQTLTIDSDPSFSETIDWTQSGNILIDISSPPTTSTIILTGDATSNPAFVLSNNDQTLTFTHTILPDVSITLQNDDSMSGGTLEMQARNFDFTTPNSVVLGDISLLGSLVVTSGGSITDSGSLTIFGNTLLSSSSSDVTLDSTLNDFVNTVSVTARHLTISDSNSLDFGDLDISGSLTATSNGAMTDSGTGPGNAINVVGTTNLFAINDDIILDSTTNDFIGTVSATANNLTLVDVNSIVLGTISVPGDVTIVSTSDDATLSSLSVDSGLITPLFDPNVFSYSSIVQSTVNDVTIFAIPNHSGATVIGDGLHILNIGVNNFPITVTAESGLVLTYTITITREAPIGTDMAIDLTDLTDPINAGSQLIYSVDVINNGPSTSTSISVGISLPSEVSYVSSITECSNNSGMLTCNFPQMANQETISFDVVTGVSPTAQGQITAAAQVSASEDDANESNNIDIENTIVNAVVDSDGDGIPDSSDVCPGFDDHVDTDSDGIPDGCDSNNSVFTAVNNGNWNDPNVWEGGIIPSDTSDIEIPNGVEVTITESIDSRGTLSNSGSITIQFVQSMQNFGTVINFGTITNEFGGSIFNLSGASFENFGTMNNEHNIVNSGTFINFGTIVTSGTLSNHDIFGNFNTITNSGTLTNDGTMTNDGDITNTSSVFNYATGIIDNFGTITNVSVNFHNFGTLNNECGGLYIGTAPNTNPVIELCVIDSDGDGITDDLDNCLNVPNPDQLDIDNDGIGNVCDIDIDNDGVNNGVDNCPLNENLDQLDIDNDGIGLVCDDLIFFNNGIHVVDDDFTIGPETTLHNEGRLTLNGNVVNDGTIFSSGLSLILNSNMENNGDVIIENPLIGFSSTYVELIAEGEFENKGNLTINQYNKARFQNALINSGEVFVNDGQILVKGIFENSGQTTINPNTIWYSSAALNNSGMLTITGNLFRIIESHSQIPNSSVNSGVIVIESTGLVIVDSDDFTNTSTGEIINHGLIRGWSNSVVFNNGIFTNNNLYDFRTSTEFVNNNEFTNNAIFDSSLGVFVNNGDFINYGEMKLTSSLLFYQNSCSGNVVNNGIISLGYITETCDTDGDFITDVLDDDPQNPSATFSDVSLGGNVFGEIITPGDLTFVLFDIPATQFSDYVGARYVSSEGLNPALVEICDSLQIRSIGIDWGWNLRCGSAIVEVTGGEIIAEHITTTGTLIEIMLDAGDEFFFDDETLEMESTEGTAEITLTGDDGTVAQVTIPENNSITFEPETSTIITDPENTEPITVIIDGTETEIEPGESETALSPRTMKENALTTLEALLVDADKKDKKNLEKAIKSLTKSLDDSLWTDDSHLVFKDGKKSFSDKTVKELDKIKSLDVSGIILYLVDADVKLATIALDDAQAYAGDKKADKQIKKAEKDIVKAEKELGKEKFDKAIKHYEKAWKHAIKAIDGDMPEPENDDGEEDEDD